MKNFFFNPYKVKAMTSIQQLRDILERTGIDDSKAFLLARYIIEQGMDNNGYVEFDPENSKSQGQVLQEL